MNRSAGCLIALALAVAGCPSDDKPDSGTPDAGDVGVAKDAEGPDSTTGQKDASIFVAHDSGGPITCNVTCDCPQGLACIQGECTGVGTPVFCCDKEGCPEGQQCLAAGDIPGVCDGDPDPVDAGSPDGGFTGQIGDYCEEDSHCDQGQGFTCWERNEAPFIWGYCTLEGCAPSCPAGSECIQFNGTPVVTGCMTDCNIDSDCRVDAHCLEIPGAPFFGVCIPDCRDDFFDCSPRDGTVYCNPTTGRFVPNCDFTPSHDANAVIGDPCINSTNCANGDICLGEIGWAFDDGLCTHVCSGLPEATPCPFGSTCQILPPPNQGLGLCFRDCVGGTCPDRGDAMCNVLDMSWAVPGCFPPPP